MSFADLPEDILKTILDLVAEDYFKQGDGFRQCCMLAKTLPYLWSLSLPRAPLTQWAKKDRSWEGIKWQVLRQSTATLEIAVQLDRPSADDLKRPHRVYTWRGPLQKEEEEGNEELEALVEVSEDKRGFRSLALKVFPVYKDDADDQTVHRIRQRLRPMVDKLLELGIADLQGLKLNADIMTSPKVLSHLPLSHLELEIGRSSKAPLSEIMMALGQCSTLEYLAILRPDTDRFYGRLEGLPDLCLHKAAYLRRVHFQAWFPAGRLCLPPGCQLRLDLGDYPLSWNQTWQSENGKELMGCISAMHLEYDSASQMSWPSHIQEFSALQYLELGRQSKLKDLALLANIPHVRVEIAQYTLSHSRGSWESLEIYGYEGFEITFADIDAFVRDNRRYLFKTLKATKIWRSMHAAMHAASCRQRVGCFAERFSCEIFPKVLSSIKDLGWSSQFVCVEDIWPKQSMQSCSGSAVAPGPKADVSACKCMPGCTGQAKDSSSAASKSDTSLSILPVPETGFQPKSTVTPGDTRGAVSDQEALPALKAEGHARHFPFRGCLTWLGRKSTAALAITCVVLSAQSALHRRSEPDLN